MTGTRKNPETTLQGDELRYNHFNYGQYPIVSVTFNHA